MTRYNLEMTSYALIATAVLLTMLAGFILILTGDAHHAAAAAAEWARSSWGKTDDLDELKNLAAVLRAGLL